MTMTLWQRHLGILVLLALGIIALFARDVMHLVTLWWTSSTYTHCLFILPILGWLAWLRAPELAKLTPRAWLPGLIWVAGGAFAWFVGDAISLALLRQIGLVVMLQGCVPAILGPQVARGLIFPLFYSLFLVPFGEELVPPMQLLTADMAMAMLKLAGVPAYIEGIFITTPGGYFAVAEACSGVKFLVAMAALSVLSAHLCFQNIWRRAGFIIFALIVPVLANGVRAAGTILMAEQWGNDFAASADHVIYGWFFFGFVMLAIWLVARPWFDREPDDVSIDAGRLAMLMPGRGSALLLVAPLAFLLAGAPMAWSAATGSVSYVTSPPVLTAPNGWQIAQGAHAGDAPWRAHFVGADARRDWRLTDHDGRNVDVTIVIYGRQSEGHELVGFGQGAVDPDSEWRWGEGLAPIGAGRVERIMNGGTARDVMTLYSVGGKLTSSPTRVKIFTLLARLTGGDDRSYAMLISAQSAPGQSGHAQVQALVNAAGGVEPLMHSLTSAH
ncbi:MAG: exosortase A [Sphingopyxis sp.]